MDRSTEQDPKPMRIHHVVADIHRQDSGPSYSVVRLAEELSKLGHDVMLHTLEPLPDRKPSVPTRFYPRRPYLRSLGISPSMRQGLTEAARDADVMHFHGLWMMPNVYPARAVRGTGCRLVMSPRGMLDSWARSWRRGRKRVFGILAQDRAVGAVDAFHATATSELDAIRTAGFDQPVAVVPIGIDMPALGRRRGGPTRRVTYLGRLHPKKNVETLISAWGRIADSRPEWQLTIAGPGTDAYVKEVQAHASSIPRTEIIGPRFGAEKAALLDQSDLFVLPTHSENFGIVVAEALSHALPVIVSSGAPWEGVVTHKCGWWVAPTADDIGAALTEATGMVPAELEQMGIHGRAWMAREFEWSAIAELTVDFYTWLRDGGTVPSFVHR